MGGFQKLLKMQLLSQSQKAPSIDYQALASQRAEEERQKNLERQKRGMESTIQTSYTGVLETKDDGLKRKKLLGE